MITCEINGTDYRITSDNAFNDQAGAISLSRIVVDIVNEDGTENPEPKGLDSIIVYDGTDPVWSGYITSVDSPKFETGYEVKKYIISVQSESALANRRIVFDAFQNKTVTYIVTSLANSILSEENITIGQISNIALTFVVYSLPGIKLADALDELANYANAVWYISPSKEFFFLLKEDFPTVSVPDDITLRKNNTAKDLRTVQIISGVKQPTDAKQKTFTQETDQSSYIVDYPIIELPTITINSVNANVGVNGLDDEDETKTFLFSYNSDTVILSQVATTSPSPGDTIDIYYKGQFDVRIVSENSTKIASIALMTGTSGKIEKSKHDATIATAEDGQNVANNLLDIFGSDENTITVETNTVVGTNMLSIWNMDNADIGISGEYVVVERSLKYIYVDDTINYVKVIVKLKDRNYINKYGSVYNQFAKNINGLSVRASEIVLGVVSTDEELGISEEYDVQQASQIFYPIAVSSGNLSEPSTLMINFYPV